ncbi:MAG: AGE family epimerase/isomerase [Treponema sp.]|nr:AGE family epimerase/isomerase [Treponema sp.]
MDILFYQSIKKELTENILPYWEKYARDTESGGFFGNIDNNNNQNKNEIRSIVMTSCFLWAYSAAARLFNKPEYLDMAEYASSSMMHQFFDKDNGGFFWSVNTDGTPCVSKKQIYGEAFAAYALSEYAAALTEIKKQTLQPYAVMDKALSIFSLLEKYARDPENGGYVEALTTDWKPTTDLKLSEKDIDCEKSINTNLHVMEAYTNLYRNLSIVYPEQKDTKILVGKSLSDLVRVSITKILQQNGHLGIYFNRDWSRIDNEISYGHDIEASWLLWEAANELSNEQLISEVRPVSVRMAMVAYEEGFDKKSGGFENTLINGKKDKTRIWWNQAEAVNGFFNAWELSGSDNFKEAFQLVWKWIEEYQVDKKNGDWFWAVNENGKPDLEQAKGGNWKTAYHNARCCMEILRRTGNAKI